MPHKAFQAARREQTKEPITFTLGRGEAEETFRCVDVLPAWIGLELAAADMDEDGRASAKATANLVQSLLIDEDLDRFLEALKRKQSPDWDAVDDTMLGELISWVFEEYAGRPTTQSSRSSRKRSPATTSSKVVSLSQGTVRAVS